MKVIEKSTSRLVLQEKEYFLKIWGLAMPLFAGTALYLILRDYTPALKPAVFICIVFIVAGLFVTLFMRKELTWEFDKDADKAVIYYPIRLATAHETTSFPISKLKELRFKKALSSASGNRVVQSSGFDFVLQAGNKIHCGIYTTQTKKIQHTAEQVAQFLHVPISYGDETDILLT